MTMVRNSRVLQTIPLLIVVFFANCPAYAEYSGNMDTYVFLTDQSTVVKTGGFAGVHETYPIQGQFQLKVDVNAAVASFGYVDAFLLSPVSSSPPQSLGELFNMTELKGTVIDETTVSFTGIASDGSDIHIKVTFRDDLVHLVGQTIPPPNSADFFIFNLDCFAQRKYSGGTGEPNDPYQIATAEDLMLLGDSTEDYDKHFILVADIDLHPRRPSGKVFDRAVIAPDIEPVIDPQPGQNLDWEFQGPPFTGVFDGNTHVIRNLHIQGAGYLGLFGQLGSEGKIFNLDLEAVDIRGSMDYVSGLVGENVGSITNSHSSGTVTGNMRVSGLTGAVGGLVGANGGSITSCYSVGTVTGNVRVGGLVGANGGSIATCYSSGSVTGNLRVGGLVGGSIGGIDASYSTGNVSGSRYVGGLIGTNGGSITTSFSTSAVIGGSNVGGLVATNSYGNITASYSTGTVSGTSDVGGLVGWSSIDNGIVIKSFWDMEASGQSSSSGGVGLTTAQMQDINTFLAEGWDFVDELPNGTCDYWHISPGDYPRLRYHAGQSPVMPEGLGTIQEPYLIRDARDLGTMWFEPMGHYRLEASIDLSGITWSMAVVPWFGGTFDGDNNAISNLHIEGSGYLGMFGQLLSEAKISNLGVEAVDVNGISGYIGGLAGESGNLNSRGGIITNCYSTGIVHGEHSIGGLVGFSYEGVITQSYCRGSVSGEGYVGGLVGFSEGIITTSYSSGTTNGDINVGGLVGGNHGSITTSYSTCTVNGDIAVGGLAGSNSHVGPSTITNCYSAGKVTGNISVSGLVGQESRSTDVISCFWDKEIVGFISGVSGKPVTTAEMQTATTFIEAGWDFVDETENGTEDIWWIDEGKGYPRLWWERSDDDMLFLVVDDFESYNDLGEEEPGSNRIYLTWVDGFDNPEINGSVAGCVFPDHSCYSHVVHSGYRSMPFSYNNKIASYSEACANIADLTIGRDWTIEGVEILSLWFRARGNLENAPEPMYVALADANGTTGVSYHSNPNAALIHTWTEWTIDLQEFADQGVGLTHVDTITIGFGNRNNPVAGGRGEMWFDDIRLYQPAP